MARRNRIAGIEVRSCAWASIWIRSGLTSLMKKSPTLLSAAAPDWRRIVRSEPARYTSPAIPLRYFILTPHLPFFPGGQLPSKEHESRTPP